jgi:hypothetical protein
VGTSGTVGVGCVGTAGTVGEGGVAGCTGTVVGGCEGPGCGGYMGGRPGPKVCPEASRTVIMPMTVKDDSHVRNFVFFMIFAFGCWLFMFSRRQLGGKLFS